MRRTRLHVPIGNHAPITCRWVYDVKRNGDNEITVYKARLTAHGFKQEKGVDYNETFAAVAQMKSFRATVALAQLLKLRVTQIDISNAFLHGILDVPIYMTHPPGYTGTERFPKGTCLKLKKGLYGLKQAGRIWNIRFIDALKEIGFKQLVCDTQVLTMKRGNTIFIIGVHVDDATLATNDEQLRRQVMEKLQKEFRVKDLGDLSHYLGVKVETDDKSTRISQPAYIEKMIAKFNMEMAENTPTPGTESQQLSKEDGPTDQAGKEEMKSKPYRGLVGSLMYSYIATRPDIGAALIKAASFCENPGHKHWKAAKKILRYLKGTATTSIEYTGELKKGEKVQITCYCDSDWAQDRDDRRSVSGYVVKLANGAVSWQSKKQPTVALSSCEAEFVAYTEATREVMWLTYFLEELGIPFETPVILTDSQSAMEWSKNAVHHQRSKHVAMKYFFIRDVVRNKTVKLQFITSKDNEADLMTKDVNINVFQRLQPRVMGAVNAIRRAVGMSESSATTCK